MSRKKILNKVRVCTQIDSVLVSKVDVIVSRTGISRSSIYNKGLSMAIEVYENKYGKIEIKEPTNNDVDEIFKY